MMSLFSSSSALVWSAAIARTLRGLAAAMALAGGGLCGGSAEAQVVYYSTLRPVVAAPVMAAPVVPMAPMMTQSTYVANYTPAGNYAAVTAFSPPVTVPTSSVAVTSYYAPTYTPPATVAYYAPAQVAAAPVVVAEPVTAYYAPVPVMGQLYRRGPLGVYRPVRSAYMIGY
jgi:hypothetical protein